MNLNYDCRKQIQYIVITVVLMQVALLSGAFANIYDDFSRSDAADIGNGWVEKSPAAFNLAGSQVVKQAVSSWYRDNIVYRPANEDVLDVEITAEFRLDSLPPGYPQVAVRIQSATANITDRLDAYLLYVNNSANQAILGRQVGSSFVTTLATINISPALDNSSLYRFFLSATGTNPVELVGRIERFNGTNWDIIGSSSFSDPSADRIATAGSVGFGGYVEGNYQFDNFRRTNLSASQNPTPVISGINPATAQAGDSGFTLTVTGSDFVDGSIVRWDGFDRTTTFVSATELQATINTVDLATAGTADVTVFNPSPGGGESDVLTFAITSGGGGSNPVPVLTGINPGSATEGDPGFVLTVTGSDFLDGSVVRWNGSDRTTTFQSTTTLQATINAADISTAGTADVTVFTPAPGGGLSGAQTFTIAAVSSNNPLPVLTGLNPAAAQAGDPGFTLTVTGSNFVDGAVVRWDGIDRVTTFVSDTQLLAIIGATDVSIEGTASVSVFNPAPGGGLSGLQTFTIGPAGSGGTTAEILSVSPGAAQVGDPGMTLSLAGNGFDETSVVRWNGSDRTTTFISPSQLEVDITAGDLANTGLSTLTVFTPGSGGGLSAPETFFILEPGASYFYDNFNRPDSADLGNGWNEKYGPAFSIQNNEVTNIETQFIYFQDNNVTRPPSEDMLDSEIGMEFIVGSGDYPAFPQVHSRVQREYLNDYFTHEGYIFFVDSWAPYPGRAMIALQPALTATMECYMYEIPFPSPLNTGDRIRLRFRVTGTDPVVLEGILERFINGRWQVFVQGSTTHDALTQRNPNLYCDPGFLSPPINTAGSVGFAKWETPSDIGDNFYWMSIGSGSTPPPTLAAINPTEAQAGDPGITLTVTGNGFVNGSVVRWNGSDRTTTFISAGELQADIPSSDIAAQGTAEVTVFNPSSGLSGSQTFTITSSGNNPVPVLSGLNPASAQAGDPGFTLTVTGSDFVDGAVVRWNGSDRITTFVSANELQAAIGATDVSVEDTVAVTVFNPAPGGGVSGNQTFTITAGGSVTNPVPVLSGLNPASAQAGDPGFQLTVTGSDFVDGAVVRWDGADLVTTFISATELRADIEATDISAQGTAGVTVFNPGPGGGLSDVQAFEIIANSGAILFSDDFNRANGVDLGNNWIEKSPDAFSLSNGEVAKNAVATWYRDNIVYRPANENVLDAEATVDFRLNSLPPGYPQIMVRIQTDTADQPGYLDGYILYINNGANQAILGRQTGGIFVTTLATMDISPGLDNTNLFRMRLSAAGTDPVELNATIERFVNSAWETIGTASATDNSAQRFDTPGSVGFGGYVEGNYRYDNFQARAIGN